MTPKERIAKCKEPGYIRGNLGSLSRHKSHDVLGWQSPTHAEFYNDLVSQLNNGIVVEIGVYGGVSLLSIAEACQNTNSCIFGIDPWEKITNVNGEDLQGDEKREFQDHMKKLRLNLEEIIRAEGYDHVILIHDFSRNVIDQFEDASVDIIYIDGNHDYKSVYMDLAVWFPKLTIGGVMWGDDFSWYGVQTAVKDFCKINEVELMHTRHWWEIRKVK